MNILILTHEFPPIGGGGGHSAYDICRELARRGHQITVLTAHMRGLPRDEIVEGIHLIRISSLRTQPYRAHFFAMAAFVLAGLWSGYRFIRSYQPDIIHAHFAVPAGALAFALSFLTGIPYVLTAHLGDVPGGVPEKTDKWFRWIMPFTYMIWKRAKRVVAVSEYTRHLALAHYPVNIEVISNGVDLRHLNPSEIKINHPPQLVFAGRFVPQKNPRIIVSVLAGLKDLDWRCAMLGDGFLLDEVKSDIENAGMRDRFYLPGWVTPEEVLELFSHSDILFMPSHAEGLPVVGLQALAKGLAIVASKIDGFMDLVDNDQNGFLVDVHDQAGFTQVLRKLITNHSLLLEYRQTSLSKADAFSIDKIAAQYEILLQDVIREC